MAAALKIGIRRRARSLGLALIAAVLAAAASGQSALRVQRVDGAATSLAAAQRSQAALVLVVPSQGELLEAQRLLTFAESRRLRTLILIELPAGGPDGPALRRAAKRFFASDFSRDRVYFIAAEAVAYRSALLRADGQVSWSSPAFPSDADFDLPLFAAPQS